MAVVDEILRAQLHPRAVMERQLETAGNEIINLCLALAFGFLSFIALIPDTVARAVLADVPPSAMLLPAAMGSLALLPIFLYLISAIQRLIGRLVGGQGTSERARRGLFWSLMVATPWSLLSGLTSEIFEGLVAFSFAVLAFGIFLLNWSIGIWINETNSLLHKARQNS
ncbi:MAG: hypothetical protein AAF198_08400 [Pseudomonadota bacterium]